MTETAGVPPADATAEKNAAEAVPANGTGAQHNAESNVENGKVEKSLFVKDWELYMDDLHHHSSLCFFCFSEFSDALHDFSCMFSGRWVPIKFDSYISLSRNESETW